MTKQKQDKEITMQNFKRTKTESKLLLLVDEVGLTEILKDRWSSSGPKERLNCLDYLRHEIEKYYLCF